MGPKSIRVCLSPALLPLFDLTDTIAVVIDIFRATSSMCYGLANGAQAIIPVAELDECLAYRENGYLLAAERDGEVVPGFDFGNSPFSYIPERVAGKTIVLTTTNGTRAIRECAAAQAVVIGSFLNIGVLTAWLSRQHHHVLFVCAGWKNHVNLEDTVFAGAVISGLKTDNVDLDDAAYVAMNLYGEAKDDLMGYLKKSSHANRMQRLNIGRDIEFCLQENLTSVIPVLKDRALVRLADNDGSSFVNSFSSAS